MIIKSNEKKENSAVELVIEVSAAEFEAAIEKVYNKQKKNIMLPGFRKGKAPRKMVEKMYGAEVFYEDAINEVYPEAYEAAITEAGLDPVAYPELDIVEVGANGLIFKALVTVKPEVSIKDYKGLVVAKPEVKVSAADVKNELKPFIDRATRLVSVDRKAKKGDTAVIDFEGFKDGVAFDGGKGENYNLALGSGTFVPGFEEQVIGMKAGQEKDIDITFPENYTPELAGAAVVFKVKVHEVKERQEPTLDDEFAKDVSEFETLEELKKDLKEKLKARRQEQAEKEYESAIIEALCEKLECEIPQAMINYRAEKMLESMAKDAKNYNMDLESYVGMFGMSMDALKAQAQVSAAQEVRTGLALDAVVEAEGIVISDEETDAKMVSLAEQYGAEIENVRASMDVKALKKDLATEKALELVKSTVKKPAKKAKEEADEGEKAE